MDCQICCVEKYVCSLPTYELARNIRKVGYIGRNYWRQRQSFYERSLIANIHVSTCIITESSNYVGLPCNVKR